MGGGKGAGNCSCTNDMYELFLTPVGRRRSAERTDCAFSVAAAVCIVIQLAAHPPDCWLLRGRWSLSRRGRRLPGVGRRGVRVNVMLMSSSRRRSSSSSRYAGRAGAEGER